MVTERKKTTNLSLINSHMFHIKTCGPAFSACVCEKQIDDFYRDQVEEFMALALASVSLTEKKLLAFSSTSTVYGGEQRRRTTRINAVLGMTELGRRGLLLSVVLSSSTTVGKQVEDSKTAILQKYLKKSEENKAKNDKQRLDDYYKRNYKDYFSFMEGSLEAKKDRKEELTESEKGILDWLEKNK